MNYKIVQAHIEHEDSILSLLSLVYGEDYHSISYFKRGWKSSLSTCTFVAQVDGGVIGVITAWKTNFHPYCTYFSLSAHPLYRDCGIEIELLSQIESVEEVIYPLQSSIWETSYSLKSFYVNEGFSEIRRTYISSLKIASLLPLEDMLIEKYSVPSVEVKNLTEINQSIKEQLIYLVKSTYESAHQDNPPGITDLKQWERLVFHTDTILEGSYVALGNDREIIGFALLHEGEEPDRLEFGWRGTNNTSVIRRSELIILLTALQVRYCRENGFTQIQGEIDTTDPHSLEMLKVFPFEPAPTLITYQKKLRTQ